LIELSGKTIGIIGLGRIGIRVAEISAGFGMNVIFYTEPDPVSIPLGARGIKINEVFRRSDIISLHCPLTEKTKHIINPTSLNLMKKSAFLINTSRGQLVDEISLVDALISGNIAGAGLDVLECEPPVQGNPLYNVKNCYITPHYSWATKEARERLIYMVVENLNSYLNGDVKNQVNQMW